ncbi:MAG TPA: Hsp20/alpha crystallin family protein [Bdellovibrionales bacterium]|nr:Hsp20/alpha crystallin family protein [Bdellovibrionales bacterium]
MAKSDKDIQVRRNDDERAVDRALDFDQVVDRFLVNPFASLFGDVPQLSRRPVSQIKETDDSYILRAELPGVPKEDIQIDVNGNLMSIRAEHSEEGESRSEYRSFQQSFTIPSTVDADRIEANVDNGVLEVLLPKAEVAQAKRIQVQTGKGGFLNRLLKKDDRVNASKNEKH